LEWEEDKCELTLRRVISRSSIRNFVDDVPVSARVLQTIGSYLVDLHGANEQLSLMSPSRQLELLDNYAGLNDLRNQCRELCAELTELSERRAEFDAGLPDESEADRLQLMVEEIERLNPQPGEDEILSARQRRGANARKILESAGVLADLLTEREDSVADRLGEVYRTLCDLERIDPALTDDLPARCADLQAAVSELSAAVAVISEKVDLDPEALAAVEARLGEIFTLKRRYGPTLEQLFISFEAAQHRLDEFKSAQKKRDEFDLKKRQLEAELLTVSKKLSEKRKLCADEFLTAVCKKLSAIGFENAVLAPEFTAAAPGITGMDHLEIIFSANKGEELRPLRKIASSGELSRLMLAFKTVLADADAVPTVIFDEIDMNIGGETANRVGDELRALGKKRQILCISHLAQVAARADEHFQVTKSSSGGRTFSTVCKLSDPVPELARMLGGGESAVRHAAELKKSVRR